MRRYSIFFLFLFSIIVNAQTLPTAGNSFTIKYDPAEKAIFDKNSKLTLVYAFDYWSTKNDASLGAEGLFSNIVNPDEGRKNETLMVEKDGIYSAEIDIPESAQLLSYYITDGNNFDYNDNKTYLSYVYDQNNNPVRGARFRNVDFIIMSGGDTKDCINEVEKELNDYPDYHLARYVLWRKKFEIEKDYYRFLDLRSAFEKEFAELKIKYPNDYDLLNAEGKTYSSYLQGLNDFVYPFFMDIQKNIFEIGEKIPDGKRDPFIENVYQSYLRQKKSKSFTEEIVSKPAIDFEFTSLDGEKKKLSDFKGKTVLLDFWGTWCGPCVGEIPNLVKVYNKFKDKGFEIISISSDLMLNTKNEEEVKAFTKENDMKWTQILDDTGRTIHNLYNISHWPTLFLIDKDGTVIKNETVLRGEQLEETLNEVLSVN